MIIAIMMTWILLHGSALTVQQKKCSENEIERGLNGIVMLTALMISIAIVIITITLTVIRMISVMDVILLHGSSLTVQRKQQ